MIRRIQKSFVSYEHFLSRLISYLFQVNHILNHTSGLHNVLADLRGEDAVVMHDWDECLRQLAASAPETEPGQCQLYHFLSFGWLCGGIIEVLVTGLPKINVSLFPPNTFPWKAYPCFSCCGLNFL